MVARADSKSPARRGASPILWRDIALLTLMEGHSFFAGSRPRHSEMSPPAWMISPARPDLSCASEGG
jgi:hypothetical protein